MITHPTPVELVRAVAQWIESVRPHLAQKDAYLARVAVNALTIVDRELSQGSDSEARSTRTLEDLLGKRGNYESLLSLLCERLRSGELDMRTSGLLPALREDTLARLAIDQPSYRHDRSG